MSTERKTSLRDPLRVAAVRRTGLLEGSSPEEFNRLLHLAARCLRAPSAAFLLLSGDGFHCRGAVGLPPYLTGRPVWPLDSDFLLETAFEGPVRIPDIREWSGASGARGNILPPQGAFLGVPLDDGEGNRLGVLGAWDERPRAWTAEELELLKEFAVTLQDILWRRLQVRRQLESLTKTANQFRITVESGSDLRYDCDMLSGRVDWDGPVDDLLGHAQGGYPRTLEGWEQSIHPEDLDRIKEGMLRHLEKRAPFFEEYRVRARDGIYRHWSDRGTALWDERGRAYRWIGIISDVTEKKKAEEAHLKTSRALQALIQASPLAITLIDMDGTVRLWNPASERIFGWSAEEVLGRLLPTVPEDMAEQHRQNLAMTASGQGLAGVETRRLRKDGSLIDVGVWTAALPGTEGKTQCLSLMADIGERKRMETELKNSRDDLDVILRTMDSGVMAIDALGKVVYANHAAAKLLDLPGAEDVLRQSNGELAAKYEILDEHLRPFPVEQRPTARAHRGEAVPGVVMCYRIKATGQVKWSMVKATPVFDGKNDVRMSINLFHDITASKKVELELARNRDELNVILNTMDGACLAQDTQGTLVFTNQAAAKTLGFASVEEMGPSTKALWEQFEIVDDQGRPVPFENLPGRRALRGESVSGEHLRYLRKDGGEVRWSLTNSTPVLDAHGNVRMAITIFSDITAIKKAELELKESRRMMEIILREVDDAIIVYDPAGKPIYINAAAARSLDIPSAEALCRAVRGGEAFPVDILDEEGNLLPREFDPVRPARAEKPTAPRLLRYRNRGNGAEGWILAKSVPVRDEGGAVQYRMTFGQNVTEIKQAEEALRLSENRLSLVFNHVSDMVTLIAVEPGPVYRLLMANQAFLTANKIPPEVLAGRRLDEVLPAEAYAAWAERWDGVLAAGKTHLEETEAFTYRKRTILESRLTPIFDGAGRCTHILGVSRDVTSRREAEDQQKKHMRYLEGVNAVSRAIEGALAVEHVLPAAMATVLRTFDCDRAWLVHPADPEALSFRIPFSAAHPDLSCPPGAEAELPAGIPIKDLIRSALAADEPVAYDAGRPLPQPSLWKGALGAESALVAVVRPQSSKPWLLCLFDASPREPWREEDLALFKDIASRVGGALGNMLYHRDLCRSEEKFRTLFERSLDGIYRCTPEGTILDANPALVEILGYAGRAELIGSSQIQLLPAGGHMSGLPDRSEAFTVALRRKSGGAVWAEINSQAIRRAGGEIAYFEGMVRNINDRKRTEEALKASEENLRQSQKMEAVGRLAGGVAHDFNNLLTAINGYSDLLLMTVESGDSRRGHVEEIRLAGQRAASLTEQLLAFSRKQVLSPRAFDLNAAVTGMENMLRRLIGENIEFHTRLDPGLKRVMADPTQMEQVILNLALNARDAMPDGGRLVIATENRRPEADGSPARCAAAGDCVQLSVSDNGCGMDGETKGRLFEPFFTTKPKDKGTGLGLSTVYGAVKQVNGTISVESEPGRGTLFLICLPALEESRPPPEDPGRPARFLPKAGMGGSETILLVEDEDAVRRLVRDVLEANGYQVLEAADGNKALEASGNYGGEIHLLLTDVVMGGMGGRELAEHLRPLRPATRILYMSGYTEDAIIRHGVMSAHTAFISKPFTPAALTAKVREILAESGRESVEV